MIELRPDVLLLDIEMPGMDGIEVARRLTTCRETFDVPVVILTCMCLEADREKGYRSGALYFMNKPFLPDDLLATVRQAIAWKAGLRGGTAAGWTWLGTTEALAGAKGLNQMTTDLFARTNLSDADVGKVRQAMERVAELARQWGQDHGGRRTRPSRVSNRRGRRHRMAVQRRIARHAGRRVLQASRDGEKERRPERHRRAARLGQGDIESER